MNEQRTQHYRRQIVELAERLKSDMTGLREAVLRTTGGEASGGLSNAPLHLADLATDNVEQEVAADLLQNDQQVIGAIAAALDRLDNGTFGRCENCGKEVPEERLNAVPYASRCIDCEQKVEREDGVDVGKGEE